MSKDDRCWSNVSEFWNFKFLQIRKITWTHEIIQKIVYSSMKRCKKACQSWWSRKIKVAHIRTRQWEKIAHSMNFPSWGWWFCRRELGPETHGGRWKNQQNLEDSKKLGRRGGSPHPPTPPHPSLGQLNHGCGNTPRPFPLICVLSGNLGKMS